jgi:asparagine N-glycosylation enzyme membrane subunit Stt3
MLSDMLGIGVIFGMVGLVFLYFVFYFTWKRDIQKIIEATALFALCLALSVLGFAAYNKLLNELTQSL